MLSDLVEVRLVLQREVSVDEFFGILTICAHLLFPVFCPDLGLVSIFLAKSMGEIF